MERVDVEGTGEGPTDSFAFISFPNLRIYLISEFGGGTGWTLYPSLSTSFMNVSPSSTGNLIFGFTISGISSCLTSPNFWTTIHFWDLIIWYYLLRHYFLWLSYLQFSCFLRLPILSGTLLLIVGDLHSNRLLLLQHTFLWSNIWRRSYILILSTFILFGIPWNSCIWDHFHHHNFCYFNVFYSEYFLSDLCRSGLPGPTQQLHALRQGHGTCTKPSKWQLMQHNCVTTDLTNVFVCHEVDQLIASMIGAHLVCQ